MRTRFGSVVLALLLVGSSGALTVEAAARPVASESVGVVRDSWIVMLDRSSDPRAEAQALARQAGGKVGLVYRHAIRGFQFKGSAKAAAALTRNPHVISVTPDHEVTATETVPFGISRIDAVAVGGGDAYAAGFRGTGARIAVIDSGIDLDHPDLVDSLDLGSGLNCVDAALPPNDEFGHGTHVAGIAAAPINDVGVVGVAPEAELVPIKSFTDAGGSSEALVLCGVDHVVALNTDVNPANDIDVANMSWGTNRAWGSCADDPLHASICAADAAGVVLVGGVGNNAGAAANFVPAAFPEVIGVSAMADFDGKPGGLAGCKFIVTLLAQICDEAFAVFSNAGPSVDVIAPGVNIYSTWAGGGYSTQSGTSMATPHVAGVAALMKAVDPTLTTAEARTILQETGEFPDGSSAGPGCQSTKQWSGDRDGIAEPLVNALRAAHRVEDPSSGSAPALTLSPANGTTVGGVVQLSAQATHSSGIASVSFFVDGLPIGTDTSDPYAASWDTGLSYDGAHQIGARATAEDGSTACALSNVSVGVNHQGSWVGTYGVDGYALGAFNGPGTTDLAVLPNATLTMEQGLRYSWAAPTTDVRALQNPAATERRGTGWYHATQVRLRLNFTAAYTGTLHVYGFDWENAGRRMSVTVADGTTTKTVPVTTSMQAGVWIHFPISVQSGGVVTISATKTAANNAVIAGLFLGGAGSPPQPPPPPPPPYETGVQGSWVGTYGVDGYALGAFNGPGTTDLAVLPNATLTMEQGLRYSWAAPTTDVRALQNPAATERRGTGWYHATQVRLRLNFTAAYTGTLHVYGFDWENAGRRMSVTVADGTTTKTVPVTTSMQAGVWIHFPISVQSGGVVTISATKTAANNAVIAGLFLGGAGSPPQPPPPPPPPYETGVQGSWVGTYGVDGYALGAFNGPGTTDLAVLPNATLTMEQGLRYSWAAPTTDVRALQNPAATERRGTGWYHATQVRLRLNFTAAYTGTLHVYGFDWENAGRRMSVTVADGTTTKTVPVTTSMQAGVWIHFPISVQSGGVVTISATKTAANNAVIAGLFLGGAGSPP